MHSLSVVIPVYNDPTGIDETLRSVSSQDHPEYEIIPVDNGSTDDTPAVIQEWAERRPDLIHPTAEPNIQSSYAARNAGIEAAEGDLIVFIDADMTAPEEWLESIDATFEEDEIDYLGYQVDVYLPEGERTLWGWYDVLFGLPSRYHYEEKNFVPTSCLAVRKQIFEEVGTFNERLASGGDNEFGKRVHNHPRLTMGFSDDIVVYHPARTTFEAHYNKEIRVGRGLMQLQHDRGDAGKVGPRLLDILLHVLPPDPVRVYRMTKKAPLRHYPLLYATHALLRLVRFGGAMTYLLKEQGR